MAKFVEDGNKQLKACAKPMAKLKKLMLGDGIEGVAEATAQLTDCVKATRAVFTSIQKLSQMVGHSQDTE